VAFTRSLFEPEDMELRDSKAVRRAADLMERLPK
jgi:hypothetical protein